MRGHILLRRFGPALLGPFATLLLFPTPALAHASVVSLEPAPGSVVSTLPSVIRIRFSEPVAAFGRGIDVYRPDGTRISSAAVVAGDTAAVTLGVEGSTAGTYLVEWRIVAEDTHPSRGAYTFSVGNPGPAPAGSLQAGDFGAVAPLGLLLQAVARWLHFLGFALSFGVLAFLLLVLREREPPPRLRRLVYLGIALLIVAEPIALVAQAASLGAVDSPSLADVLGSAFGRVLALRLGAALLLWGLMGALREVGRRWAWSVLILGIALALVDGLGGHTIRGVPELAALLLTAVHVGAMAGWVGGFAALLAVHGAGSDRLRLLSRFGRLAVASVALLVTSGLLLAVIHLRSPADLFGTAYGLTLAIKVAAVTVTLGAAYLGLRSARSGRPEAVALAAVLALAGLLSSLPPPR